MEKEKYKQPIILCGMDARLLKDLFYIKDILIYDHI